jgi:hypothetical protein
VALRRRHDKGHITGMRKRKREKDRTWEIRGLKASPAAFIGFPVAFVGCGLVRRLETAESGLDGRKPGNGYVITVRRGRPFREFGSPVLITEPR